MGIFERIREPKTEGVASLLGVAPIVLASLLIAVGVSSTSRRNCVLFIFGMEWPAV